jgi:hypothetical protein
MTPKEREMEIRLDILGSLARSQHALADMLEGIAALTLESPEAAEQVRRQAEVLVRHQTVLAEKLYGIRISRLVKGRPGRVWLSAKVSRGRVEGRTG